MISKSRLVLALTLTVALGVSGIAFAGTTGAQENDSSVEGQVTKKIGKNKPKLDKKKAKKVNLFIETATDFGAPPGEQENAEELYVDFSKNIKFKLNKAPTCSAVIAGTTTEGARDACPDGSLIGTGDASALIQTGATTFTEFNDIVTSLFNGPSPGEIRVHTHSDSLDPGQTGANSQVIDASVVSSPLGKPYKKRIAAPNLPDIQGDAGGLFRFNVLITKQDKVVRAKCKKKTMHFAATHVYDDGSSNQDFDEHKCKQKESGKGGGGGGGGGK